MSNNLEDDSKSMPFISHLVELRDKLIKIIIVVLVFFLILLPFASEVYTLVATPLLEALPIEGNANMISIGVISPFLTPLKLVLILSIYLAMPFILYQVWSFIAPGLYQNEKKLILPLVVSSTILFYFGLFFSFFVVFPLAFSFLATIGPEAVNFAPDIANYLDFVLKVSFAFGVAFEVPIATILFITFGATTIDKLKKNRPYIIIGAFVLGMLLTPPDVISQTLIAIPMLLLFELGLLFAPYFANRKQDLLNDKQNLTDDEDDGEADFDEIDKQFANMNKDK